MGDEEGEVVEEVVSLDFISIEPNNCAIDEPLNLAMDFTLTRDVLDARWEIKVRCGEEMPDASAQSVVRPSGAVARVHTVGHGRAAQRPDTLARSCAPPPHSSSPTKPTSARLSCSGRRRQSTTPPGRRAWPF
eukprot:5137661-Prymnesium_polylepis.1